MNRQLYELTAEYQSILELIYDTTCNDDGQIDPNLIASLDSVKSDIAFTAESVVKMLRDMAGTQLAITEEANRLKMRADSLAAQQERIKSWLKTELEGVGLQKLQAGIFRLSICNSPASVEILDIDAIPHDYDKPSERQVLKMEIAKDLKAGKHVPGAALVNGTHLRIA